MFWEKSRTIQSHIQSLGFLPLMYFGFAFTRRWTFILSSFTLGDAASLAVFGLLGALSSTLMLIAGSMIVLKTGFLYKKGILIPISALITIMGSIPVLFFDAPEVLLMGGTALANIGFSMLFLLWLEFYGLLKPVQMILAYSGSMLLNVLITSFANLIIPSVAPYVILTFPLISAVCLIFCYLHLNDSEFNRDASPATTAWDASFKKLIAWLCIFGFAFGASSAVISETAVGMSTLGRFVFSAVLFFGTLQFPKKFTLILVYRITLPLMILALALGFFSDLAPLLPQFFLSAGMDGYQALSIIVCCGMAMHKNVSAAFYCGIAFAIETISIQIGRIAIVTLQNYISLNFIIVGIVLIFALVIATLFLFKESDLTASYSERALEAIRDNEFFTRELTSHAKVYGLTDKELSVFILMVRGMSTKEIAAEFYLAPSTVRVHTSKIYQKLDVHNREEFDKLVKTLL
ncbi:MAG: helix-turn-helix transcriptional regulator [Coriobacteriales bacterium]|nr:helix-turn-helix transcriptional regulator [Coriobacteriales bacterium]